MDITRPTPRPDPVSQGFWDAAARGQLTVQRCAACATFQHPPRPICRACSGTDLAWQRVSGEATLWSWTVTHHGVVGGLDAALPYICLVVELAEQKGLFMLSDLIGRAAPAALRLGMPMRAVFPANEAPVLPQFAPAEGTP